VAKTTSATTAPQQPSTPNRRKFFRRTKPFQGVYYATPGERVPLVGLDISGGGLCVLLQQPVKDLSAELMLGAVIQSKPFTVIGTVRWSDVVKVKGVDHYRYGLKLKSIADDDWDRLMLWTVENNSDFSEGATLSAAQRDSLITQQTQDKIAEALLAKNRIDPYSEHKLPLIEYNFVKYTMRQGAPYVWLRVRSRCTDKTLQTVVDHMTNVLVSCDDGHTKLIDVD
jgi:hypothetical protein